MYGRLDSGKKNAVGEDSINGRLLHEIEALSKALYLNKQPPPKKALPSAPPSNRRSVSAGKTHFPEPHKTKPSRAFRENPSQKDKKSSSFWNWKPLKALSHIRHRRFNCLFSLQVHSIEGLPSEFDGVRLVVHWRRRDGGAETQACRVFDGIAEFEEILTHECSVYGSGNGPHHSAKYEAKHFLICALVVGAPHLDLGKHRVDLTRLLPLTLEELEEEKSSGKWTTSFKLSGMAKGATLNVSFGFLVLGDDSAGSGVDVIERQLPNSKLNRIGTVKSESGHDRADAQASLRCGGSLPGASRQSHIPSQSVEAVKILHEDLPSSRSEVSGSVVLGQPLAYGKFNEGEFGSDLVDYKLKHEVVFSDHGSKFYSLAESLKDACENDSDDAEFTVIDRGIEVSTKDLVKEEEDNKDAGDVPVVGNIKIDESSKREGATGLEVAMPNQQDEAYRSNVEEFPIVGWDSQEDSLFTEELIMKELDSALCDPSILKVEESGSSHSQSEDPRQLIHTEVKSIYKKGKVGKSLSLDDATASVASEFLSMLGIEHSPFGSSSDSDPDSPRERLLKQFDRDSLACGSGIFGIDIGKEMDMELVNDSVQVDPKNLSEDFELSSFVHTAEAEHQKAAQTLKNKTRAKMLEDAEAEALMREWGLNENSFQSSAPGSADGFGSPIDLPLEEPFLPPLGEGLGPLVQTKDGGFLRSMNPSLFMNAKNNGSLIMQVSSPIVVPAEMGSGFMEILQGLASIGIEKLSMQASKLMPLEDVTGKTMQQVAWEAAPALEACKRDDTLQHLQPEWRSEVRHDAFRGREKGKNSSTLTSSVGRDLDSEYVSLEDLAPLAMDKIEALSMEGLRIQSGMSDDDAPSNISSQSYGEISALSGQRAKGSRSLGLEGAAGLQLMDIKDGNKDVDGLMGLSITLDEWMRLDAGILDDKEQNSSRTSKILSAHHASCTDLTSGGWKGDKRGGKCSGRRCGLLGNNFMVALMVQLRNPLRNYEPVGTPMLALIQVERVFIPPKPKIYSNVSLNGNSEEADEPSPPVLEEEKKEVDEVTIPQFKITEVHVAGIKTEPTKKNLWGGKMQQQSGSRWLLASGMGKSNKHPFMKSKAVTKSPQVTATVLPGDTLWSISSRVHGTGAKWKELAALNPHIRNPNVIFPNETIRLR